MKIYAIVPLIAATISFTVGFYDFLSWLQRKKQPYSLSFVAICLGIGLFGVACAIEYNTDDPGVLVLCLRSEAILLNISGIAFLWFLSNQTGLVRHPWKLFFLSLCGLGVLVQTVGFGDLTWNTQEVFRVQTELPFGMSVNQLEVRAGPLTFVQIFYGLLLLVHNSVVAWRYHLKRRDAKSFMLVLSMAIIALSYVNDFLVDQSVYPFIYMIEYSWLAVIVIMGIQRGQALIEAGRVLTALAESEGRYRAIFESLQDVYFRTDAHGKILLLSPSLTAVFGYQPSQIMGTPAWRFLPDQAMRQVLFSGLREDGRVVDLEVGLIGPDRRRFEVSISAQVNHSGSARIIEGMIRDIAERKQTSLALRSALHDKDVLMDEIHHRVKNNLQVISSLLKLQLFKLEDPFSRSVLQDCRNQVFAMAMIHDELYQSHSFKEIDFGGYLKNLVSRLIVSFGMENSVSFVPEIEGISLPIVKAIPCGLIVNELCTNILKYAFSPDSTDQKRELRVRIACQDPGMVCLEVADNGNGLPPGFDLTSTKTLGLKIITQLCRQLDARLTTSIPSGGGTLFSLVFPHAGPC